MSEQRVFFHGLNELRACAALSVLAAHVELYKNRDGHASLYGTPLKYCVSHLGENGVYLFFVLSGFLITYLLLEETARAGSISLRSFYLRRVLRIWPLYYLLVALGFGLLPQLARLPLFGHETYYLLRISQLDYGKNLALHLGLLSNLALLVFPPVAAVSQSWSVSVEEQFYLIWPVLLKGFRQRPLLMLLCVLGFKLGLTWLLARLAWHTPSAPGLKLAARFLRELKIELMAVGGLAALWLRHDRPRITDWLKRRGVGLTLVGAIGVQLLVYGNYFALGLCFALLILFVVTTELKNRWLDALGKISYGIYMYHPLCMFVGFALVHSRLQPHGPAYQVAGYVVVLGLTLVLSSLSFRFFESPFLKLKARVSPVPSGTS